MSEPSSPRNRDEEQSARLEAGYRKPIGDAVRAAEEAEKQAHAAMRIAQLERSLSGAEEGAPFPAWIVALRVGAAVLVWGGLVAVGAWLFGVWGGVGGLAAPIVLLLLWAVGGYYGSKLIDGKARPVGKLLINLRAAEREVLFVWRGPEAALPVALLAQLDRSGWELGGIARLTLMLRVRGVAEAHLRGVRLQMSEWVAAPGERGDTSIIVQRFRTGIAYSTSHSFSLSDAGPSPTSRSEAALAIVEHGLQLFEGEGFARAVVDVAKHYEKGRKNARTVVKKYAKILGV